MQIKVFFLFLILGFSASSQVEFQKVKHDFGELEPYSARYVDIVLKNVGNKQEWLLSVKKPFEVVYINSKQFIEVDSSIIVRLQVNPKEKGRFSYVVDVYTSDRDEATKIKLTGNFKSVDQSNTNAFTACPNFDERPGGRDPNGFKLTVVTIDKQTREELENSTVSLLQSGQPVWTLKTDRNGKIKEEATLGFSYFYATHKGYNPAELGAYINFKRNFIVLELDRDPDIPTPVIVDTILVDNDPEPEIEIDDHVEEDTSEFIAELPPELKDLDTEDFGDENFKPINVVFVLDISASMKSADKMELMKYSLFQLTDMLRAQDKMGIVTYSSTADVLLKPTPGSQKEAIKTQVEGLKAQGFTAGGTAIKMGYKQVRKSLLDDGINHVVIITDGAFNRESKNYKKTIRKYARKGIHLSVVGIKNKTKDQKEMKAVAELGGGHYVPIFKLVDARDNLKQEIRAISFRYK